MNLIKSITITLFSQQQKNNNRVGLLVFYRFSLVFSLEVLSFGFTFATFYLNRTN